jgi:NADH-quinone oxidoreductase subunit N
MSSLPKIAAVAILLRLLAGPLAPELALWQPGLQILAASSMVVGSVVAIVQRNLKRLLAWSTIANVGFILVGAASGNPEGAAGTLFYVTVYAVTSLGLFAGIMLAYAETTEHLKGLAHRAPWLATGLAINLFSLAGVPPLAGFMGKLNVFVPAIHAGMVPLVVVGVLASVVACFYSLYLIKLMVFEEPTTAVPLLRRRGLEVVLTVSALINLALGLLPGMLYDALRTVATTVM